MTKLYAVSSALLTGLVSTIICIPINIALFDGSTGNVWGDALKDMLDRDISSQWFNSFAGEAFVDLHDRVVSLFIALFILKIASPLLGNKGGKTARLPKLPQAPQR